MLRSSYAFRSFVKERICQLYDTVEYASLHPFSTLKKEAHQATLDFIRTTCPRAIPCRTPRRLMDLALSHVAVDGYYLEFGVFKGASLRYIAKKAGMERSGNWAAGQPRIYGFDSFEGLAEPWVHNTVGAYSSHGRQPTVPSSVQLVKGNFEDTVQEWLEQHEGKVAFLHVDCDLYSSTATVFDALGDRLQEGTVILFDDYFNFPNWQEDGHKVFTAYVREKSVGVHYLGYGFKELAVQLSSQKTLRERL